MTGRIYIYIFFFFAVSVWFPYTRTHTHTYTHFFIEITKSRDACELASMKRGCFCTSLDCVHMRTHVLSSLALVGVWTQLQTNVAKWLKRNVHRRIAVCAGVIKGNACDRTQRIPFTLKFFAESICQEFVPGGRGENRQVVPCTRLCDSQWFPKLLRVPQYGNSNKGASSGRRHHLEITNLLRSSFLSRRKSGDEDFFKKLYVLLKDR